MLSLITAKISNRREAVHKNSMSTKKLNNKPKALNYSFSHKETNNQPKLNIEPKLKNNFVIKPKPVIGLAHSPALIKPNTYTELFTDASASPYGGVACTGWIRKGTRKEVHFSLKESHHMTTQMLEAKAIVQAIRENRTCKILYVNSDSQAGIKIVQSAINKTDHNIAASFLGAITIEDLIRVATRIEIKFIWVKSHQDNDWNVLCDQLVRYGRNCLKEGNPIHEVNVSAKKVLEEMMRVRNLN